MRIAIEGELAALVERIQGRTYKVTSLALVRNEDGQPLSASALDNRFEDARKRAARILGEPTGKRKQPRFGSSSFAIYRLRPAPTRPMPQTWREAQKQLGHKSLKMTENYVRKRAGAKVTPTK